MTRSPEPRRITVPLGDRSYPILIGTGLLSESRLVDEQLAGRPVLVITDTNVAPHYLDPVMSGLARNAASLEAMILEPGEDRKTAESWLEVLDRLVAIRATRDALIIALGGGVIGDLCGFAAAAYMRGIDFIQVPTTLLAQVDASVGGKTAINHPEGKNLIGAFHQPVAVVIDVTTLQTLPEREYAAGLAETVKYGAIRDSGFFAWLESHAAELADREPTALTEAIERSCRIKAEVVANDETEQGQRAHLNFGHTFGHALETATGYRRFLHGEAVAVGMVLAARLSAKLRLTDDEAAGRLETLLARFGLPVRIPADLQAERLYDLMTLDKKNRAGEIRLILLEQLGKSVIRAGVGRSELLDILAAAETAE
ncbi:MAG: 3-dehydroquinate synthase [Xanthomonadales bacterium]|nr:3-dehydroquinate synthase [Xanthomonadales bacterium]